MVLVAWVVGTGECVFFLVHPLTQMIMAALRRLGRALVMRQPTDALGRISCPLRSRCSHLESGASSPLSLYLAVVVRGVWVFLFNTKIGFAGDDCFRGCNIWFDIGHMFCDSTLVAMDEFHTFSALRQTRILKCCSPFFCRTENRAQSMLPVSVLLCAVRIWKTGSIFTSFTWLRFVIRDRIFWGTCVRHRCGVPVQPVSQTPGWPAHVPINS